MFGYQRLSQLVCSLSEEEAYQLKNSSDSDAVKLREMMAELSVGYDNRADSLSDYMEKMRATCKHFEVYLQKVRQ